MPDRLANILLVDDDLNFLTVMEEVLAGPGRMIFKAQSGNEALRQLLQRDFALILLDVRMPGLDGFEAADLIRRRERSRYTPIIFMSGTETVGKDVMYGIAKGAVDYILKPFTLDLLKSRVATFVDLFHLHERLGQEALQKADDARECSTPLLTLRTGLLLVLITGLVDRERLSGLEGRLLKQIHETQAKAIVIDVTGASIEIDVIPAIQASVEAVQQTGARIIFTGSNTSISNAMFVSNSRINGVITADDLQAGIQQAERILSEAGSSSTN
jgi:CheY-like chemotaxis protein